MSTVYVSGLEVKVGDTFPGFGQVISFRPYVGKLLDVLGAGTRIARVFGGREVTVPAVGAMEVVEAEHSLTAQQVQSMDSTFGAL